MPIYEYECSECGERFEFRRNMSDDDGEIRCPKCGVEEVGRVFSVFAAGFSGNACAPSRPT